jgi:RHS repeat-associated protein
MKNWLQSIMARAISNACIFIITVSAGVHAQTNESGFKSTFNLVPKSPEASSIIKYIDFPVSHYTGTPQISFPIASFEEYDHVSASVSLSYHASGNKVGEVAESVGLGWHLNAGGMITRQVYGIPDDASHCQGFLSFRQTNTFASVQNKFNTNQSAALDEYALNVSDIEPDEFYFSFNGYEGKFAFDWTPGSLPVLSTSSPIKISNFTQDPSNNRILSWELTDGFGVKYTFSEIELTTINSLSGGRLEGICNGPHAFASGWHLTKITSPNTAYFIDFQYDSYGYTKTSEFFYETCSVSAGGGSACPNYQTSPGSTTCHDGSNATINYSLSGKRLKKISNSTGKFDISVTATTARTDNPGTATNFMRVDAITYKQSGLLFSKTNFAYFYQGNRLMLESLEEEGENGTKIPKYTFSYNSGTLSSYDSKAIDHWGYQNGNTSNRLIPQFFADFGGIKLIPGADRSPQLAGSKAQVLEKITNPNGGYTEFEYEQHDCSYINGTTVESKPQFTSTTMLPAVSAVGSTSAWTTMEQSINISNYAVNCSAIISGSTWAYYQGPSYLPQAYIKNSQGVIIFSWQLTLAEFGVCNPPCSSSQNVFISLAPGTYTIGCKARKFPDSPPTNGNDFISFQLNYDQVSPAPPALKQPVGGLRIKEVRSYDPLASQTLTKKYQYSDEDNTNYSSGVIYADPINFYTRKYIYQNQNCQTGDCDFWDMVGTSRFAVGSTSGSHIGYRRVIEIIGTNQDGGKTVLNFTSPKEYSDAINTIKPFARPETQAYKTGLLTKKRLYDKNNNLVVQEDIQYAFKEFSINAPKVGFGNYDRGLVVIGPPGVCTDAYEQLPASEKFAAWWGLLKMGFARVSSKTSRAYFGTNYVETQTTFTYDTPLQLLKSTTTKDLSIGYEWKQEITYPRDYACPSACTSTDPAMMAILEMISRNQLAYPIEQTSWLKKPGFANFQLLNAQLLEYDQFGGFQNIRPSKLHVLSTSSPITNFTASSRNASNQLVKDSRYVQEYAYGFDNTTGTIIQQNRVATSWDAKEQYIWSHERRLPIAYISNANANEVAFTSFEDAGIGADKNGGWAISATGGWNSAAGYFVTGKQGYNVGTKTITRSSVPAGKYIVSFWFRDANINVNGTTVTTSPGSTWKYVETTITLSAAGSVIVTGASTASYIDELRLYPADALMQTFSYDNDRLLLLSTADESGTPMHYEYDDLHRLRALRNLDRNIRQTYQYTFATAGTALNNVKTRTLLAPTTDFASASSTTSGLTQVNYSDGLGRPVQTNMVAMSPTGKDIIMPTQYDIVGRQVRSYLPYTNTTNGGAYRTNAFSEQATFANSFGAGGYGYSETAYDLSPLNRTVANAAPGASWQMGTNNKTTIAYRSNTAADNVRNFFGNTNYAADALMVIEVTDENGKKSFTFKDKMGKLILVKQQIPATLANNDDTDYSRTYTVYDDFGRVVAVIPPEAAKKMKTDNNWDPNHANYNSMVYRYQYDARGRMVSKTVPSAGTTTITYDRLDRPVLSTDAKGFKVFTRYDILSRPVVMGKYKGTATPANTDPLFETPNTTSTTHFYTSTSFPTDNNLDVYKVMYYDDYDIDNNGSLGTAETYTNPAEAPYATSALLTVRGKPTASKTGILKNDGTAPTVFLMARSYVDKEYNLIQTNRQNHLSGSDIVSTAYDFGLRVTDMRRDHTATPPGGTAQSHTLRENYVYDAAGRLRFTRHKINTNNWVVTAAPLYDELGRLVDNRLHASNYDGTSALSLSSTFNYLQSMDYTYNIRSWLTGINDPTLCTTQAGDNLVDMFRMSLTYESTATGATAQFNGNISSIQWNTHINGTCGTRQLYRFSYDGANRLTSAAHRIWGLGWTDPARYNESNITYDLNGNLKSYTRQGLTSGTNTFGTTDQLAYFYEDAARPDRLTRVTDAGSATKGFKFSSTATTPHYVYDLNGNMTQDKHKNMMLTYNYLNLPQSFTVGSNVLNIIYTADGEKISKNAESSSTSINYVAGIEYLGTNLEAIYHSEGRCTPNGATAFHYEYTLRDHLGNARVNFRANGTAVTFLEETHYYPFGLVMEGISATATTTNRYKYNGKELNTDFGIDLTDYGARWYDAALGRWNVVDPMSEATIWSSGYAYTLGNPIKYIDLFGMVPTGPTDDCTCISGTEIADGANKAIAQHNANLTADAGSNGDWNQGGGSFGPNLEWTRYKLSDGTYTKPMLTGTGGGDVWDRMTTIDLTLGGPRVDGVQVGFWIPVLHQESTVMDGEAGYGYRTHKSYYAEQSPALADFDMTNFIPSKGMLKGSMALGGLLVRGGRGLAGSGLGLSQHLRQLEKYGTGGYKELANGRFRYYGQSSLNKGNPNSFRMVREWNPVTNGKRTWFETLNPSGNIIQVRPEFGTGIKIHYLFDDTGGYLGKW